MVSEFTMRVWMGSGNRESVTFSGIEILPPSKSAMIISS